MKNVHNPKKMGRKIITDLLCREIF